MLDGILKGMGIVAGAEGKLVGLSEEFREFYTSGYRCPKCKERLMNVLGQMTVNFYTSDGEIIPLWKGAVLRAQVAECPKCKYRWPTRGNATVQAAPQPAPSQVEVVETDRTEEPLGVETRVIDNSRSGVTLTRKFTVSREWSKQYNIEYEKAKTGNAGVTLGVEKVASLNAGFEQTIRRHFSISQEMKDVYSEEIEIQVPGAKKLSVVLAWKRIWQLGFLRFRDSLGHESQVPFKVVTGVTFDQSQIDS